MKKLRKAVRRWLRRPFACKLGFHQWYVTCVALLVTTTRYGGVVYDEACTCCDATANRVSIAKGGKACRRCVS